MTKHKDEIIRLGNEGKSYREIQKILGCSKGTISYHLGMGQKEKMLSRQRMIRTKVAAFLQEYKQKSGCFDCKENYPYWMLEFDHLGDKSFTISNYRNHTVSIDLIKKEIKKCQVVCANCHKNRTFLRNIKNGNGSLDVSEYYAGTGHE
jgi:DNA-binding CsgD family transcriptional regulator